MHVTTYAQINTHTQWPSIAMFLKHVLKTCLLIYNWNFTFMWRTVGCWFFPGSMFQQQERNTGECKRMKVKWRSIPWGKPNTQGGLGSVKSRVYISQVCLATIRKSEWSNCIKTDQPHQMQHLSPHPISGRHACPHTWESTPCKRKHQRGFLLRT